MTAPYYSDDYVTIYHGDCRHVTEWLAADALVTDPPYGMSYESGWTRSSSRVENDDSTEVRDVALSMWGQRPALVFGRWSVKRPPGVRMVLTWEKGDHTGMGDLSLPWKLTTEELYVIGRGFKGEGRRSSVLRFNAPAPPTSRVHPTEKPLDLMLHLVLVSPGQVVADPFMGVGATLRAAKDLGRKAIGVELDERYCEIAARRMRQEVLDFGGAA